MGSDVDFRSFGRSKQKFRFNILRHANLALPALADADIFDLNGVRIGSTGLVTATSASARQVQSTLMLPW